MVESANDGKVANSGSKNWPSIDDARNRSCRTGNSSEGKDQQHTGFAVRKVGCMGQENQVWAGNWRARLADRLKRAGYESIYDFLARHPATSYSILADKLGDNVAALQLEWIQFWNVD